jgi:hypothetical protein
MTSRSSPVSDSSRNLSRQRNLRGVRSGLGGSMTTPAGWYPDPSGNGGQRYFDGVQWGPTAPTAPAPHASPAPKNPKGIRWGLLIAVLGVIGFFGIVGSCGHSGSSSSSSSSPASSASEAAPISPTLSPEQIQEQQQAEAARLDPTTYNAISPHDYAVLLKDPDAHKGEKIIVYGVVTQFDTNTGDSEFRADTAAEPHDDRFGYDQNTMVDASDPSILASVVKNDFVQMYVEVEGTETYKATLGADRTVPKFNVNIIKVTGSSQ